MKRSTWTGQTVVYRYGCPSWADLPPEGIEQLRLAHQLRNELVAVEYRYRELVGAIWGLCPDVEAAKAVVDEATSQIEQVAKATKDDRVVLRHTAATSRRKDELKGARQARRDAKAALKAAKDTAHATVKPLLAECARARYAALTEVRADSVERGLFWATGNDVLQCHDTAAKRIAEAWKAGAAARRRFRRWDGSGTLSTQVMWGRGKPPRTPAVLSSLDSPWRNVFRIESGPAAGLRIAEVGRASISTNAGAEASYPRRPQAAVWLRVAKGSEPISVPIVYHRPLPDDGDVTDVRLTRFRVGAQSRLAVCVTVRLPSPAPKVGGVPVSVVLGWSAVGDGAVRVARLGSPFGTLPVPPPDQPELREWLVPGDGGVDVVVPSAVSLLWERDERIRSHRDELLDELRPLVVAAIETGAEVANPRHERDEVASALTVADVVRWRSPRRFATLARLWPADHPLAVTLEAWRQRDRHLWEFEAHERRQLVDRRRDAYRKVAAWLADQASEILIDAPPLAVLKRVAPLGEEDTYQARAGRRQAQLGAPGDLRAAIVIAAARRGVKVIDTRTEEAA